MFWAKDQRGVVGTIGSISCPAFPGGYGTGGCGGTTGVGVYGDSQSHAGVNGVSQSAAGVQGTSQSQGVTGAVGTIACPSTASGTPAATVAGVVGCGGAVGDGVLAEITHAANGGTAAAVHAINYGGGDILIGQGIGGVRVARIDGAGKAYFDGGVQDSGADYADSMRADHAGRLRPGDVLVIDPQRPNTVGLSRASNSTLVAGVYSTKPAVLGVGAHQLGSSLEGTVPVALVGVVPTRVSTANGPIKVGDLLTTSAIPGYAMRAVPVMVHGVAIYPTGMILGKAMEPLNSGKGLIQVLVTLR